MTLLNFCLFLPLAGFVALILFPRDNHAAIRKAALVISLVVFVASLGLAVRLQTSAAGYQFETDIPWISTPSIRYHIGIDGLSLWLVILTTLLTPIAVLISWRHIGRRVKEFHAFLLLMEFGLIGVFVALDLFLFYVFWEVSLVPMYFLIGVWGHERRIYAAVKFFLYTMAGSVLMLAAMIYLYTMTETFDYPSIAAMLSTGQLTLGPREQMLMFLAFFLSFAIKVPLFPLHTWLPDAHVEAPTAGSVILASVMLKMGTYGILRFCLPLFPAASRESAPWIVSLAIIGIIYGALVAMVQPNMKKLVAYSSVSHLGFVVLGIPFLRIFFGAAYERAYVPMLILLAGQLVNAGTGSVVTLLNMTGYERETAKGIVVSAGLNLVLNLWLIPLWGIIGSAVATTASMIVWNLVLWWAVRKNLGVNTVAFARLK